MPRHTRSSFARMRDLLPLLSGRSPGQLIIQYSNACNATCPQCELRVSNSFRRATLPPDEVRRMIDAAARYGVRALSFTGGEPLLRADDLFGLIEHAHRAGIPYVRTGTNGFVFAGVERPGWEARVHGIAERIAATGLHTFWISMDSADPAVHERMRGLPGVTAGIEKALDIFRDYSVHPSVNLGVNRNTGGPADPALCDEMAEADSGAYTGRWRKMFARFYRRVTGMGFTIASACYPMSVQGTGDGTTEAVYGASSADTVVRFTGREKGLMFRALMETIPAFRSDIRIFTPRSSLLALVRSYESGVMQGAPCRGGIDYFYIDAASGHTFPCGFRGNENLGPFYDLDWKSLKKPAFCRACDWECFRDPSELLGPAFGLLSNPFTLAGRFIRDREYFSLWLEDIRYQAACSYYNGMTPPDHGRMAPFASPDSGAGPEEAASDERPEKPAAMAGA